MNTRRLVFASVIALCLPLVCAAAPDPSRPRAPVPSEWSDAHPRIGYHRATGRIRFVGSDPVRPIRMPAGAAAPGPITAEAAARAFVGAYREAFGVADPDRDLALVHEKAAEGRRYLRFQQTHQGLPVVAGEIVVQLDDAGRAVAAVAKILPDIVLDTRPAIPPALAMRRALAAAASAEAVGEETLEARAPVLVVLNPILLRRGVDETHLAWEVEVVPRQAGPIDDKVYVDAAGGAVLMQYNQVPTTKQRETYTAGNGTTLPGTFVCGESDPACSAGDAHAVGAHLSAGDTYDFYWTHHGRDSIDNAGMVLRASVHYSVGYANAYWDPLLHQMVYGDAYGFPLADDVVAHEMTHGVTAAESKLAYYYESGAINESLSDVFGEFVDLTNGRGTDTAAVRWLLGEDVQGSGAARDMKNPPAHNQPDKMTSFLYAVLPSDNGGVHTNSGVGNKAAYLMTDGGTFNGFTVAGLGIDKVAALYYEAQTHLLIGGSDYADLHDILVQACLNLAGTHGIVVADCAEVQKAVDAVQMDATPAGFYGEAALCPAGQVPSDLFYDNIDDTQGAHFAETVIQGQSEWLIPWNSYPASGAWHLLALDDRPLSDAAVAMTVDTPLPAGTSYLHFNHAFGLHSDDLYSIYYHGGVLEYSLNGGATWTDAAALVDAGGNGYNGWIADPGTNPLHGRAAWGGKSRGYISSRFNLSTLAGHSVRFRWRLATDSAGADSGWAIDDVRIYTCVPQTGPGCTSPVQDGGFEAGTPNPFWTEASTSWGTPLCDMTSCGIPGGARTGSWWVGFGRRHGAPETGSVQQSVALPAGTAHLRFYLRIFLSSGNHTDFVRALLDGTEIFRALEGTAPYTTGYTPVDLDLSSWADGGTHLLRLESQTTGVPMGSYFFVDDVSLTCCPATVPSLVLRFDARDDLSWGPSLGFDGFDLYRGDLDVLRSTGEYTQMPGANPAAWRDCEIAEGRLYDPELPAAGKGSFYLVTGLVSGVEGSLGTNSAGLERTRTHACP